MAMNPLGIINCAGQQLGILRGPLKSIEKSELAVALACGF
jgi:uncharacterized protein YllA (UPF0747 family)